MNIENNIPKCPGIYQIINLKNKKRYIGSSIEPMRRKKEHFKSLELNIHYNKHLQGAYNKHGKENFTFKILLYCDKENLIFYEQRAIDAYNFNKELYNVCQKADSCLGFKKSEESRKRQSERQIGEKNHMFGRYGKLNHFYGKHHSQKIKEILRENSTGKNNPNFGKKKSIEIRKKMSNSSPNKKSIKAFYYYSKKYIGEFDSITACAKFLGIQRQGISKVVRKKRKKYFNYYFEYIK